MIKRWDLVNKDTKFHGRDSYQLSECRLLMMTLLVGVTKHHVSVLFGFRTIVYSDEHDPALRYESGNRKIRGSKPTCKLKKPSQSFGSTNTIVSSAAIFCYFVDRKILFYSVTCPTIYFSSTSPYFRIFPRFAVYTQGYFSSFKDNCSYRKKKLVGKTIFSLPHCGLI